MQYCCGAANVTAYKLGRRCTAMVWLALTNALTRLDLGNIYMVAQAFLPQSDYPGACSPRCGLIHTFYFCPAGTHVLLLPCWYDTILMVRHPRSLVVGGGWDDKMFWHDVVYYVHTASYDPPEQPLLHRGVRGRPRVGRGLATPTQNWSQSTVASQ